MMEFSLELGNTTFCINKHWGEPWKEVYRTQEGSF
jgi:hypothetical protein